VRAKDANAGVVAGDAGFLGVVLHGDAVDLHTREPIGVLRLERTDEIADAFADRYSISSGAPSASISLAKAFRRRVVS
jgi:hypothetical protein